MKQTWLNIRKCFCIACVLFILTDISCKKLVKVDAPDDSLRRPVDEPGCEQGADYQQRDPQTPGEDPFADVTGPEALPAFGYGQCQ